MQICSLVCEDPLAGEMATYSSILAWKFPWTEEPGGLHSTRGQEESDTTEHACVQYIVMNIRGMLIMKICPSPHLPGVCCSELNHQP